MDYDRQTGYGAKDEGERRVYKLRVRVSSVFDLEAADVNAREICGPQASLLGEQ
jgi:hypothetical protein